MKSLAQLDQLNLDAATKTQVSALMQTLIDQSERDAALLQSKDAIISAKTAEIHTKELKISALTHEIAYYKRIRYSFKSEAFSVAQRDLFQETWNTDLSAIEAELEQLQGQSSDTSVNKPKLSRTGRQPLPAHLPRVEVRHESEQCVCGQCGNAQLTKIGEDISEQLHIEPAVFSVIRHLRPQYACRQCEIVIADPIPPAVIDGGLATVNLLTWVIISKYLDHLPLYRLEQIAARSQVPLSRSTMADWVGRVGVTLQPLVERLSHYLLQTDCLLADETPVAQLDPEARKGKTRKAYLWAYRSNDLRDQTAPRIIVFDYRQGRSGEYAREFLGDWTGHLMVDDYAGYKALFVENVQKSACVELACFAHARRKFFDLYQASQSPMAFEALARIAKLYVIEQECKEVSTEKRQQMRMEKSLPLLKSLHEWLVETRVNIAPGTSAAKALDYTLKRWPALIRYAGTGHLPIDNNAVENCIRPIALGKKNWLFVGSVRAGQRAAAIQSLLGTAKLNGLDPAQWLRDTLEKLPTWPNRRIDELLPFSAEQLAAIQLLNS
jgi:transposase